MIYLWLKVLHQFSMMAWFAGLWYLPRLFVYHAESSETAVHAQLQIMMAKLYRYIMLPALCFVLISGLSLFYLHTSLYLKAGWFHTKVTMVLLLIAYHFRCRWHLSAFQKGKNIYSGLYFRVLNEVPTILLLIILIMVIIQPI